MHEARLECDVPVHACKVSHAFSGNPGACLQLPRMCLSTVLPVVMIKVPVHVHVHVLQVPVCSPEIHLPSSETQ